jgi:hypothetical protein
MSQKQSRPIGFSALIIGALFAGCGSRDDLPLGQVSGVVELDGEPLANARVEFNPIQTREQAATTQDGKKNKSIISGSFAITDENTVKISTRNVDPDSPGVKRERVPRQYNVQTELTQEVYEGENVADFSLISSTTAKR